MVDSHMERKPYMISPGYFVVTCQQGCHQNLLRVQIYLRSFPLAKDGVN